MLNHYEKSFYEEKDFSDILETTEKLQKMLASLKFLKFIPYFGRSKKFTNVLEWYAHYIESTIFWTLLNLKKELFQKMTKKSEILSTAKSELQKTSEWNHTLSNITFLQSARLDQQIEQFEALQKVLIKV
jgi:hypothetical protein